MTTNRTTSAHTPFPWGVHCYRSESTGWAVYELECENESDEEMEANARLMEIACAAHDDMLTALQIAENMVRGVMMYETPGSGEYHRYQWVLDVIHAALK